MKHGEGRRSEARSSVRASKDLDALVAGALELGVSLTTAQAEQLLRHLELVQQHAQRVNLTTIKDKDVAILAHIVDSLAVLAYLEDLRSGDTIADIGSGAGYPGIPIAIVGKSPVTLIESVGKKSSFLEVVRVELGLHDRLAVLGARAEEVPESLSGSFQAVTARALTSLPSLVELASPLLAMGGRLVAMKGRPDQSESDSGAAACASVGMRPAGRFDYSLPALDHARSIFIYERCGNPSRVLPRRTGMAQRRPLA